jgi:hypothetical protein
MNAAVYSTPPPIQETIKDAADYRIGRMFPSSGAVSITAPWFGNISLAQVQGRLSRGLDLVIQESSDLIPSLSRVINSRVIDQALKQEFNALAKDWRDETAHSSFLRDRVTHPAYLEIIGLGEKVIPLIIERLEKKENHWFPALRAIARQNPIPNGSTFPDAVKLWKKWLREKASNHGVDF